MSSLLRNGFVTDFAKLSLFEGVAADLLQLVSQDMVRVFNHEEIILLKGAQPKALVVTLTGETCVFVDDNIFLCSRKPPSVLGELAFIDESVHSATVKAQGLVQALVLPNELVQSLMKDNAFNRNLLRVVSGRLREATEERAIHYRREQLLFAEFRDHSSPEIVNRMLATGVNYGAPHFIDECVILFSDIRGFTESSSKMAANDIAEQLSLYLDSVVEIIHRHEGLVDKFIGDAVMAIWGYVPTDDDKAAQAFACAEEMVRVAATMQFGAQPISIGVGLNAGRVFIGNIGGHGKRQFTVLGSPVNLASRYEGHSKKLAVPIVMGEGFQGLLPSDLRSRVVAHHEQVITGAGPQTLYSYDPIASE